MKQRLLFLVDEGIHLLRSILGHFVLADPIRDPELKKSDSELSVSRGYLEQELGEAAPPHWKI